MLILPINEAESFQYDQLFPIALNFFMNFCVDSCIYLIATIQCNDRNGELLNGSDYMHTFK